MGEKYTIIKIILIGLIYCGSEYYEYDALYDDKALYNQYAPIEQNKNYSYVIDQGVKNKYAENNK